MRDSTEEYLNSLRPRPLGLLVLLVIGIAEPWRWLPRRLGGGAESRDWMRALFATLFLPWTPWIWRRRAARLAADHGNHPLVATLCDKPDNRLIVASAGLRFIVQPLLEALLPRRFELLASPWWEPARGRRKLDMMRHTGHGDIAGACVLTNDPDDDAVLLADGGTAHLVQWPQMHREPALKGIYAPLYYTQHVKRRGRNVVLQTIVAEDFAFWLLATAWLSAELWLHGGGLLFLLSSFWCIYEIGYKENDLVAERFESAPTLSEAFTRNRQRITFVQPWLWAVGLALPGLSLLDAAGTLRTPLPLALTAWMGVLVSLRLIYLAFNHANKPTRIWIFPLLQGFRSFAPLAVTAANYLGVVLLMAHVMARSMHYLAYRTLGARAAWPTLPICLVRLMLVVFMLLAVAMASDGIAVDASWQLAAILGWCGYRARIDIADAIRGVRPIWRDG